MFQQNISLQKTKYVSNVLKMANLTVAHPVIRNMQLHKKYAESTYASL